MFWRSFLPNLSISLNLAMVVVVYLDMRNPMMGFLEGWPFLILVMVAVLTSIATALVLYGDFRSGKYRHKRSKSRKKSREAEENSEFQ